MDKWLIEELYSSESCRHRVQYIHSNKGLPLYSRCSLDIKILYSDRPLCDKSTCPLGIKNNLKRDKQ